MVCNFQLNCLVRMIIYGQGRKAFLSSKEMTSKRSVMWLTSKDMVKEGLRDDVKILSASYLFCCF